MSPLWTLLFSAIMRWEVWHIEAGKLYVFVDQKVRDKWVATIAEGSLHRSRENWGKRHWTGAVMTMRVQSADPIPAIDAEGDIAFPCTEGTTFFGQQSLCVIQSFIARHVMYSDIQPRRQISGPASAPKERTMVAGPTRVAQTTQCCKDLEIIISESDVRANWPRVQAIRGLSPMVLSGCGEN